MIKRSSNQNGNSSPFLLKPVGKDYLWGGDRLKEDFSKTIKMNPLAETWECSTHPDGPSQVASGVHKGKLLSQVLKEHTEYLGTHQILNGELPFLIKLIDAKENLSVQVHPDDNYAIQNENGALGKSEMWYVLDADKNTQLIYGFHHDMDADRIKAAIKNKSIEKYLQKVRIKKDDVFFIEAGIVHAIGAGALIAEIQENSNITYRLYDYDRKDKNGQGRELQIDKAIKVAKLKGGIEPRQPMRILKYRRGCATELLCKCKYFQVERILLNTERCRNMAVLKTDINSFQVLLCTNGCGIIIGGDDTLICFLKGDCIFIPANSPEVKLHGKAQMLKISC